MRLIEIDFEVFKKITAKRTSEDVTENDVLRELFGLKPQKSPKPHQAFNKKSWVIKGIEFPHGTKFRANYKGKPYEAIVENAKLYLNGKNYHSPSQAAISITNNTVNGWTFWECQFPEKTNWQLLKSLRNR